MTGLQKLQAFCVKLEHYPSRFAIQQEIERLLVEEAEQDIPFHPCADCNVVQDKASQKVEQMAKELGVLKTELVAAYRRMDEIMEEQ